MFEFVERSIIRDTSNVKRERLTIHD